MILIKLQQHQRLFLCNFTAFYHCSYISLIFPSHPTIYFSLLFSYSPYFFNFVAMFKSRIWREKYRILFRRSRRRRNGTRRRRRYGTWVTFLLFWRRRWFFLDFEYWIRFESNYHFFGFWLIFFMVFLEINMK